MAKDNYDQVTQQNASDAHKAFRDFEVENGRMEARAFFQNVNMAGKSLLMTGYNISTLPSSEALATREYFKITHPEVGRTGFFAGMDTDNRALNNLKTSIVQTIPIIAAIAKGDPEDILSDDKRSTEETNAFAEPLLQLLRKRRASEQPVLIGEATIVSKISGKPVGEKVILVTSAELQRFAAALATLHKRFSGMTAKADRQDPSKLLHELQKTLVTLIAGEDVAAKSRGEIMEMITDLPLHTDALELTTGDIAVMSSEDYRLWLDGLARCHKKANALLQVDPNQWISVYGAPRAPKVKLAFIKLSDLP